MANPKESPSPDMLDIEISDEVAEGMYSNLVIITHSDAEFIVDFLSLMPGVTKNKVKARVILTPMHAKRFMKAMEDNIRNFESVNGPIKDMGEVEIPMNFGGPTAEA